MPDSQDTPTLADGFANTGSNLQKKSQGVAALVASIAATLGSRFGSVTVHGELQAFMRAGSGHCYFSLKDADGGSALIRCAMFKRAASMVAFRPTDGQLVEVRGRIAVYEPRGELQFVVESMKQAGDGALYERFLRLKEKLESEGLFDAGSKLELPSFPRSIGVVTSLGAAALHDVLTAIARRAPHVGVVVYPSAVQGAQAPGELCQAIDTADRRAEVDTLIVCRGGGSLEDLWSFNDERVVRAIHACSIPVVCGVGHETDVSLSDFAADVRAPTPTAAAEMATPLRDACLAGLTGQAALMQRHVHHALDRQAQRLDRAALRLARPADQLRHHSQALHSVRHRMQVAVRRGMVDREQSQARLATRLLRAATTLRTAQAHRLATLQLRLQALDPRQVLARGYAWVSDERGAALMSISQTAAGQALTVTLIDGELTATVDRTQESQQAPTIVRLAE